MFKKAVAVLALLVVANCEDLYKKCGDSVDCAEQELIKVVDDYDKEKEVSVLGDTVVLEKVGNPVQSPRTSEGLTDRLLRYVEDHQIKIKFSEGIEMGRSLVSGKYIFLVSVMTVLGRTAIIG